MAIDRRSGTKIDKSLNRSDALATRVDPYPYIGIVKSNYDTTRSGRLQVYIPDFGGDEDAKNNWRTVRYASPFMGYTNYDNASDLNNFENVSHNYGMWAPAPDIGVQVICIFIAGDPQKGYWFACVNPNLSHHMIPALAGSTNIDYDTITDKDKKTFVSKNPMPVAEFNEHDSFLTNPYFYNNPKPVHTTQYNILKNQGLDRDPIRGAISSSSQRESPSHVFGVSTPGRQLNDPADDKKYAQKVKDGTLSAADLKVKGRKGGHTFVMDDGAVMGEDQLVRLRTARGHQLLMHDTSNSLYLAHADGTSWIEMTTDGSIKIYSKAGFALRSEGTINVHSDGNINFNAGNNIRLKAENKIELESGKTTLLTGSLAVTSTGKIEMKSGGAYNMESGSGLSLKATSKIIQNAAGISQNSDPAPAINDVKELQINMLPDTAFNSELGVWINKGKSLSTIATVAPSHEPYFRGDPPVFFVPESNGVTPQSEFKGKSDRTKQLGGAGVKQPAGDKAVRNQPTPKEAVGSFSKDQTQAFNAQMADSNSGGAYDKVDETTGALGKYQMGVEDLKAAGFVKENVTSNDDLANPNSWTGKDGIENQDTFLANTDVQEDMMAEYTNKNYTTLVSEGVITAEMTSDEIAGVMAVAHELGAEDAVKWRKGELTDPEKLGLGDDYFQKGKYASSVIAPTVAEINAG